MKNEDHKTLEGPNINILHHRLTEFPKDWLESELPPYFYALVHDAVFIHCPKLKAAQLAVFSKSFEQCQWYQASLLIAYFISHDSFRALSFSYKDIIKLLESTAKELHEAGRIHVYVTDVDRREEFIRVVLAALKLRPQGESENQAEDRLQAVSSIERIKVLQAAKAAEQRAHDLRVALAQKRAREAADKMSRE